VRILGWDGERTRERIDDLAVEEPLEIRVGGRSVSVTMRTPGHDAELAAGFLFTEGVIARRDDLFRIAHCDRHEHDNAVNVLLAPGVIVDVDRLTRHVFASSSCGLCGKATIDAVRRAHPPVGPGIAVDPTRLVALSRQMRAAQSAFERTGGLHAAAVFDAAGRLVVLREDVGRHNAVDKVVGHCLLEGPFPLDGHVLLVSGRASFEIVQKALAARVPIVAAVSAPSSLAVALAEEGGQTLVGFLRDGRMNVYAHPGRIGFARGGGRNTSLQPIVA